MVSYHIVRGPGKRQSSWLGGLHDPVVGRALRVLHQRLDEVWTLRGLANEIGCSRSTLADRFTSQLGVPPMQYLTRWRMQVACSRLLEHATKNAAVATKSATSRKRRSAARSSARSE